MPLRSPARISRQPRPWPRAVSSVLPPRKNMRPVKSGLPGWAARNQLRPVSAARRFDFSMAAETGMYFVVPVVVPEESAR